MDLQQPIFVVGVGRSGSSVFHELFSEHEEVAWLSQICDRHPHRLELNRMVMRALDVPGIGDLVRRRYYPAECYRFWDRYFRGFSTPCRDLVAEDVSERTKKRVRRALGQIVTASRARPVIKVTGWPRVGALHAIFPDARFVHVIRDGRAVANSLVNVDWWWGWRGPDNWRCGELSEEYDREWRKHDQSFLALAGIEWKIMMDAMEAARRTVPAERFLELRYEALCENPVAVFQHVIEFCGLNPSKRLDRMIRARGLTSTNDKWRTDLSPTQGRVLGSVLQTHLERHGYADAP